jgi:sortase (surface protein transpeptidase)
MLSVYPAVSQVDYQSHTHISSGYPTAEESLMSRLRSNAQMVFYPRHALWLTLLMFLLAGCQVVFVPVPVPQGMQADAATVEPVAALPVDESLPPVTLTIPALDLEFPVTPMGWTITGSDEGRTTAWQVPEESLGWQITSAAAGAAGRVIIAGHQRLGAALLAPLAQGEIEAGQEIWLTNSAGNVFVYRITEVSEPVIQLGATPEEEAAAMSYVAPTEEPSLTLITGWPDFTTTHRVFAVAEFVGLRN